jgi:uncharacterized protein Yka (UPF0111/DUF47 family)
MTSTLAVVQQKEPRFDALERMLFGEQKARNRRLANLRAAFDKVDTTDRLDDLADLIEEWAEAYRDEAGAEILALAEGCKKMSEERHAIIENISEQIIKLGESFEEQEARARMIRTLTEIEERKRDEF